MKIAIEVSKRSTCDRKHVGCVIVKDNTILATGYNGSIRGMEHCDDIGHMMENTHCVRVIHAEVNAICQAAKHGINISNSEIYVTCSPCFNCFKSLVQSGIKKIYYNEFYRDERIFEIAEKLNIILEKVEINEN